MSTGSGDPPENAVPKRHRRALLLLILGLALIATVLAVGLERDGLHRAAHQASTSVAVRNTGGQPRRKGPSGATTTLGSDSPSTGPAAPPAPVRALAVTMTEVPIVDVSRSVVRQGTGLAQQRSLPTYVWSPTASGHYPLVIFVHGYNLGPLNYARFCSALASSGYIVAAPSFPLEDPTRGLGLDRSDLPNEATDVSFVITALEHTPLSHQFKSSQIAVVGHSDGADVALMVGYQVGKVDQRVRAIVADAPDPMSGSIAASTAPLLLFQGTADSVVPYSASETVFGQIMAPGILRFAAGRGSSSADRGRNGVDPGCR